MLGFFHGGYSDEEWDWGIVVIDIAARMIAWNTTYTVILHSGDIQYHDGKKLTDVWVPFQIPDDWLIVGSVDELEGRAPERSFERAATPPLDVRQLIYHAFSEFIANDCLSSVAKSDDDPVRDIHARWLLTPTKALSVYNNHTRTALADDQGESHPPIAYDIEKSGPFSSKQLLPGAKLDFTILFSVPENTKPKDLVFTLRIIDSHDKGNDTPVSLSPAPADESGSH